MTAITSGAGRLPARLAVTRAGLHRVAEHILAAALHAETGEIALMPSPGGFRTPPFGRDRRFLAVDGTELVVGDADSSRRAALTTLRAAAEFAGIRPGAPAEVYRPATPFDLDEPLTIDPAAARVLADWYQLSEQALRRFAAEIPDDQPSAAVLWPEHFDLGITAGAINYGASPGDAQVAGPYLYVGPHDGPPPGDPAFWNAPFGAVRTIDRIGTAADAAAFFRDGRARVLARATATPMRRTP
jgi:hypothetical protein